MNDHRQSADHQPERCLFCGEKWPCEVTRLRGDVDETRAALSRLMDKCRETSDGLGSWDEGSEWLDWAHEEVRQIWLRSSPDPEVRSAARTRR